MRAIMWIDCAGACGKKVRTTDGNICRECWSRVPLELRRDWQRATRTGSYARGKRAVQADIQAWIAANPAPKRQKDEVPLWRRHKQERKGD